MGQHKKKEGGKWERIRDEDTGDCYEHHTVTGETRWVDDDDDGSASDDGNVNVEAASEDHATSSDKGWERILDEDTGDWFEYHTATGATRWVEDGGED